MHACAYHDHIYVIFKGSQAGEKKKSDLIRERDAFECFMNLKK